VTDLTDVPRTEPSRGAKRLGGIEANELLTSSVAALLTILLLAEAATIVDIGGLLRAHMFIGLMLIGPLALKLSSTGYRFARYYRGAPAYRAKGPPQLVLRVLAPVLVATTVMIFATGIWLLLLGHHSDQVLMLHKVAFFIWSAVFAVHFLAYLPTAARSLRAAWVPTGQRHAVTGTAVSALLVVVALAAGIALALSLLSLIGDWHGRDRGQDARSSSQAGYAQKLGVRSGGLLDLEHARRVRGRVDVVAADATVS
jgi:hypothetical protein